MKKNFVTRTLANSCLLVLVGCSSLESMKTSLNKMQEESVKKNAELVKKKDQELIDTVKKQSFYNTDLTCGDAVANYQFFTKREWRVVTNEKGQKVVQFTGEVDVNNTLSSDTSARLDIVDPCLIIQFGTSPSRPHKAHILSIQKKGKTKTGDVVTEDAKNNWLFGIRDNSSVKGTFFWKVNIDS